jgi:hypothetical protein
MFTGPSFGDIRTGCPFTDTTQEPPEMSTTGWGSFAWLIDRSSPWKRVYDFTSPCPSTLAGAIAAKRSAAGNRAHTAVGFFLTERGFDSIFISGTKVRTPMGGEILHF